MKFVTLFLLFLSVDTQARAFEINPLYGQDNRRDFSQTGSEYKKLADSTAALIVNSFLAKKGSKYLIDAPTLEDVDGVCSSERFRQQPSASICSGTLIGPDLMLTAAHCYSNNLTCQNASWVFNYHDSKNGKYEIKAKEVYRCKEVVYKSFNLENGQDFAVVKLDRPVKNHKPVKLRESGHPELNTPLVLIGHPRGLPTKIADDAWITEVKSNFFLTNVDAYTGNSGSGVFHAQSLELEGVLSFGKEDYTDEDKSCVTSAVYSMQDGGEAVMKIDEVRDFLKTYQPTSP